MKKCNITHTLASISGTQYSTLKSAEINKGKYSIPKSARIKEGLKVLKAIISDYILRPVEISGSFINITAAFIIEINNTFSLLYVYY
jgi:hypothetical protein